MYGHETLESPEFKVVPSRYSLAMVLTKCLSVESCCLVAVHLSNWLAMSSVLLDFQSKSMSLPPLWPVWNGETRTQGTGTSCQELGMQTFVNDRDGCLTRIAQ
jgi:hypothetical protein